MKTVPENAEKIRSSIHIEGSEFIGCAKPISNAEAAHQFQKTLREEHAKATHHCLAFRIHPEGVQEFASDDGEPSGTAGLPMLNALRSAEVINIAVVVVRYFGGTKLGKKGLIEAYRRSVEETLTEAQVIEIRRWRTFVFLFGYEQTARVNQFLHGLEHRVKSEEFGEKVYKKIQVPETESPLIRDRVQAFLAEGIQVEDLGTCWA